ncbi:cutinase family protein [Nocardia terpenica]|nr:cutinase family protein [Nocardia terpenica]NQE88929.1 cutinase family protein [Nocardia terpenica]
MAACGASAAEPAEPGVPLQNCPSLYVLAVQGTGQSSPLTPPDGADAGMLGAVLAPLRATGPRLVAHAYVPYEAGFGGAVPGGDVPYVASVSGGLDRLRSMAATVLADCPRTELGLLGYSQGAHIVSIFAREIGDGSGVVPADRVAAVALLADPTRGPAASLFPGAPDRSAPAAVPGTTGADVSGLQADVRQVAEGEGIGPDGDIATDFGALTGRVASLCLPGDLACDAPSMPLLRVLVNIAGQAELNPADPIAALTSIVVAVQATAARTVTEVIDHDLRGSTLGTLSLVPGWSLSQRLADASDPRETPDTRAAVLKLATSAVNSLLAVTGRMLTPADIAEVAALAAADPNAAIALLAEKFVTADRRATPRGAVFHLITDLVDAVANLIDDSGRLLDPAVWWKYLDTASQHGAYQTAAFTTSGQPAVEYISDWFNAAARDLTHHLLPTPASDSPHTPRIPPPAPTAAPQPSAAPSPVIDAPVPPAAAPSAPSATDPSAAASSAADPSAAAPSAAAPPGAPSTAAPSVAFPPAAAPPLPSSPPPAVHGTTSTVTRTGEPGRDLAWVLVLAALASTAYIARRIRHRRTRTGTTSNATRASGDPHFTTEATAPEYPIPHSPPTSPTPTDEHTHEYATTTPGA